MLTAGGWIERGHHEQPAASLQLVTAGGPEIEGDEHQASGAGTVSAAAVTVRVSAGCGPGWGVIRSVKAHRTTVPGLHPAVASEQDARTAKRLRVFMWHCPSCDPDLVGQLARPLVVAGSRGPRAVPPANSRADVTSSSA